MSMSKNKNNKLNTNTNTNLNLNLNLDKFNSEIMPQVKTIQDKMEMLQKKFNIKKDVFDFKEITIEEISKTD